MWFIIDLVLLGVILLCTFLGYKRGLIGVAFKIVSFFIAILVAVVLSGPVSNWIMNNTTIAQNMENAIIDRLVDEKAEEKEVDKSDINNTSQAVVDYINKQTSEVKNAGIRSAAKDITESAIRVAVIIILYIVTKIILIFFKAIAKALGELPIIKQFNKLGGTIYGILEGLLITYVILAALSLIAPMVKDATVFELINNSIITRFMYNNNIILNILLK